MCTAGYPEPYAFSRRVYERLRDRRARVRPRPRQPVPRYRAARLRARRLAVRQHVAPPDHRRPRPRARRTRRRPLRRADAAPLVRVPRHADAASRGSCRATSPCRRTRRRTSSPRWVSTPTRCTSCRSVSTRRSSGRCPHVARVPGRLMTTASADVPLKGLTYLIEALAKVRTERPDAHLVVIGQPRHKSAVPAQIERLGLQDAIEFVSGVSDERIVELYAEAEIAVVPSLYEGFSLPADRSDGVRRPAGHDDRRRAARGRRSAGRERHARPARRSRCARRADRRGAERRRAARPLSAKAAGAACSTVSPGARPPKALPSTTTSSSKRTPRRQFDAGVALSC